MSQQSITSNPSQRRERILRAAFLLLALLLLALMMRLPPNDSGDVVEYASVLSALAHHGSPAIRPADVYPDASLFDSYPGFYRDRLALNGHVYSWHFWIYPLACVPAFLVLQALHLAPLAAFQITNLALFLAAIYVVLFSGAAIGESADFDESETLSRRVILAALAVSGPAVTYLAWQGPEIWSWAFCLIALAWAGRRRFVAAALCAALAAMQNPPLLLLAMWIAWSAWRSDAATPRTRVLATAAALLSFAPNLYFLLALGVVNPMAAHGLAAPRFVSAARTFSLFFDWNDGLLVQAPVLTTAFLWGAAQVVRKRERAAIGLLVALCGAMLAAQMIVNWSSACFGLKRYLIWMLPIFALFAARVFPDSRRGAQLAVGALVLQLALLPLVATDYTRNSVLARFALTHFPALVNPQVENFATRNGAPLAQADNWESFLPLVFTAPSGSVTKILTRGDDLAQVRPRYQVSARYESALLRQARARPFYANPPRGSIVRR